MGLASAMNTALTGLSSSETQIDVIGNNLANSNTPGFKASDAAFATQFLQTQSVGVSPSATTGGLNPVQMGLGSMVAEITPNFSQGTISTANSPTDLAIQGDGFFIVQGATGQQLYTRDGTFTTNSQNQLVTSTGNSLMGYGVDKQFAIDSSQLQPLQIPLGTASVAKATQNVTLQGALTPSGNVATTAQIIETNQLTDNSLSFPPAGPTAALATDSSGKIITGGPLSGTYQYYVTYVNGNEESRPQLVPAQSPLTNGNDITLTALPVDTSGQWKNIKIYRNTNDQPGDTNFYQVAELPMGTTSYTDISADDTIRAGGDILSMYGPPVTDNTLLKDVVTYANNTYSQPFPINGTLEFTGSKGGSTLTMQSLKITDSTTVKDLTNFIQNALGIQQSPGPDASNPIPTDSGSGLAPGATITVDGRIEIVGNNGTANAVGIGVSAFQLVSNGSSPQTTTVSLPFNTTQTALGESAKTNVVVYDSLGMPLSVTVTAVLQARTSTATLYRWFAECGQNDPSAGSQQGIAVGTGTVTFDGQGNYVSSSNDTVSIGRANEPSVKPLSFNLDFSQVSGLASDSASLSVSQQDGSAPGVLSSFTIGGDGKITGVFSNGISQTLGQIQLARFANPDGLEQQGQNMYATGVNSGLPMEANPGDQGTGSIVSGSLELSNADIGASLIGLITASTMYSSNTRVITTGQQLFDQLLNLIR